MPKLIFLFVFSYLVGSIPFCYIIGKIVKNIDLRQVGTKNPGGSNLTINAGLGYGLLGGFLDVAKGAVLVIIARNLGYSTTEIAIISLGLIIGHCWSLYLNFKGGRGISTVMGTMLIAFPRYFSISMIPSLIFLAFNVLGYNKIFGFIIDTNIGTIVGLVIFITLNLSNTEYHIAFIGIIILIIICIRRVTENISEYKTRNGWKTFLVRLFYDRDIYWRNPHRIGKT